MVISYTNYQTIEIKNFSDQSLYDIIFKNPGYIIFYVL